MADNECFLEKVHHETIGRHSDISHCFPPQPHRACVCAVTFVMCLFLALSAWVFPWLPLWIVGPLETLTREGPFALSYVRHSHTYSQNLEPFAPVCGRGSLHHLCLVGCFSCSLMIFASPAPPGRARDHLPKLVTILTSQSAQHRTAPGQTVLSYARWCQGSRFIYIIYLYGVPLFAKLVTYNTKLVLLAKKYLVIALN